MRVVIAASSGVSLVNFRGNLIRDIVARGHDVTCISCEPPEEWEAAVKELGASYVQVPMSRTGTAFFEDVKTIFAFKKTLKELNPDVFFAYMSKPIAYGGMAAKMLKIPNMYVLVSGLEIAFYSGGLKNAVVRFVLKTLFGNTHKACKKIFFQNPDDQAVFKKLGIVTDEQTVLVNGSGVDMTHFTRKPLPEEPVVLMVARLVWSKGIREYLRAAQLVKEQRPNVRFLLVGGLDTNPESLTKDELDEHIGASTIEYLGHSGDVREHLEKCSVFVLPSYHEGTPRSVLEAMATGRPIITTDAPGCRETVKEGYNGYLVPVGDSEQMAARIIELADDAAKRQQMADHAYSMCDEKYDVVKVNRQMIKEMEL
ncbi:MAG: glycosyltransferase family 4 protein [Clostridia bacterium]|nr:glycosyltransferase family 4 protein [Clostridia bacterium]